MLYLAVNDPQLLEQRMQIGPAAETERSKKIVIVAVLLVLAARPAVSATDHRLGWSIFIHILTPGSNAGAVGLDQPSCLDRRRQGHAGVAKAQPPQMVGRGHEAQPISAASTMANSCWCAAWILLWLTIQSKLGFTTSGANEFWPA
jgi:hypothetical protein